jgi:hypothetical protein
MKMIQTKKRKKKMVVLLGSMKVCTKAVRAPTEEFKASLEGVEPKHNNKNHKTLT